MEERKNLGLFDDATSGSNPSVEPNTQEIAEISQGTPNNALRAESGLTAQSAIETEIKNSNSGQENNSKEDTQDVPKAPEDTADTPADQEIQASPETQPTSNAIPAGSIAPKDASAAPKDPIDKGFFEGEVKNNENSPIYPADDQPVKSNHLGSIIRAIVIILIIGLAAWYLGLADKVNKNSTDQFDNMSIVVDDSRQEGTVTIVGEDELGNINQSAQTGQNLVAPNTVKIKAFYRKTGDADCNRVYVLERQTEKKYDSDLINAIRGLLAPLSEAEKAAGYVTLIPAGTTLGFIKINGNKADISFSNSLNSVSGACAIAGVKSQIIQTAKQFPYIKNVVICINGNCAQDQVLKP